MIPLGSTTLVPNGPDQSIAVFSTTGLLAGTHVIEAIYNGDGNFNTATSSALSFTLSGLQRHDESADSYRQSRRWCAGLRAAGGDRRLHRNGLFRLYAAARYGDDLRVQSRFAGC